MINTRLRYPVGIQTFSEIVEGGYTYVDKTKYISMLINMGKHVFISRPRRFGKSLFVSTLKAFFEGRKELFENLDIEKDSVEWNSWPVLHFDFNSGLFHIEDGLRIRLDNSLAEYEDKYGISPKERGYAAVAVRFENIIRKAYETTGKKVVILIDEYDKPLLGLDKYPDIYENNQRVLKSFYGNLKSMDEYIRFCFITGVARFSKVSIFSDLNNLEDISLEDEFADICGITEEELIHTFRPGIEVLAQKRGKSFEDTLDTMRKYYDGYKFTAEGSRLYNPFSVLRALNSKSIDPFWFSTGTPTFLAELIRENKIDPGDINDRFYGKRELEQVVWGSSDPIPLMFQTGYLTIDTYDPEFQEYTLRFPNREVEIGFSEELLPLYMNGANNPGSEFAMSKYKRDLGTGNPEDFMRRLATFFKHIPYEDQNEGVYRTVTYLLCKLCSMNVQAESHSYKGRSDLEVLTNRFIYLFEFKYNKSLKEAETQLLDRDYSGKFDLDIRTGYQIAVNLVNKLGERKLEYKIFKFK